MKRHTAQRTTALLFGIALTAAALAQTGSVRLYTLTHTSNPADPKATGRVTVKTIDATTSETTLTLAGLTPGVAYAAHYHALGPSVIDNNPCTSAGSVTLGFPTFKASTTGRATVTVRAERARLTGDEAAYINVHRADNLASIILCAPLIKINAANGAITPVTTASASPTQATQTVRLANNKFQPASLTVKVGTTVTWKHEDAQTHNVISASLPSLRSRDLEKGDTFAYTFTKAGTYTYYCSYHEGMTATITVTDK